jgi:hypothetical protein
MDSESEQSEKRIVALPSLVAAPQEMIERAYELWSTVGGRNAAAVRRLLIEEADEGDAIPNERTIRQWAKHHAWSVAADEMVRETKDLTQYQLWVRYRAIMLRGADVILKAQTGGYAGNELEGALAVKATEVGNRFIERGALPVVVAPPSPPIDTEVLSRDEAEAQVKSAMVRRGRKASG